ncbi:MAG TPA: M24 family metallopeptidase [Candidatus Methylomirabilis sp.]|nr:M24 family metallopeptidase [Candidatus Methylomirabilis sp.]
MARLYSDARTVEEMTGLSLKSSMTMPTQDHDRRHVQPLVLSTGKQEYLLIRHIDSSNLVACRFSRMPVLTFTPYWLPEPVRGVHATIADAVGSVMGSERLTVDGAMPVSVYEQLSAALPVEVERQAAIPVDAFRVKRSDVLRRFNHHRSDTAEIARSLMQGHPRFECLESWLTDRPNQSFELLDEMAAAQGLSALLGTWFTNFQELSGRHGSLADDLGYAALYPVKSDEVWILAPAGLGVEGVVAGQHYPSLSRAVKDIAGSGVVGFETDTLGAAHLLDLQDAGAALTDGGTVLRDWREEKASSDIPYFVVGALASRDAMEGAVAFADEAIRSGVEITERDVDRVYWSRLSEFRRRHQLPLKLAPYFTNNHAGSRTILPSRPTGYPLSNAITSLRLDVGIFVVDDGLVHACTDFARTVTTTDAATEVFDVMERAVLEDIIPGVHPGMSGEEIHRLGVGKMAAHEPVFHRHGYMPDHFSWRHGYTRDIGHVIERQESYTFGFKPGVTRAVHPGMVACVEFHCPYRDHGMIIEDTFVVDERGAILISRAPEEFGPDGTVMRRRR